MIQGILCTENLIVVNISPLHILFTVNTVKTICPINAAAEYEVEKAVEAERQRSALISVSWDWISDWDSEWPWMNMEADMHQKDVYKRDL